MSRWLFLLLSFAMVLPAHAAENLVPAGRATALDGHAVVLPRDLSPVTLLIVGFSKKSSEATTAWEKPVRTQLATRPGVGFYDIAELASVPSFLRSLVVRMIRKGVPDVLKPRFLPLFDDEAAWKQVAGFDANAPDAAYVMVVDARGFVRWRTHAGFSETEFEQLKGVSMTH